jgi:Secretion system C-terminal sorting domain
MKHFLSLLAIAVLFNTPHAFAQFYPVDSATFTFGFADTLSDSLISGWVIYPFTSDTNVISVDTAGCRLWQIGKTLKPVFSNDTIASTGIMTDTLKPYPRNADDHFTIRITNFITNPIITIWHRFQTDSGHAGGIVEYSNDSGTTWLNVANCYFSSTGFYSLADTISTGQSAFTGNSKGEESSTIQFLNCFGEREMSTSCSIGFQPLYLRFRFVSDSIVDSLSGWKIDSIKVTSYTCPGKVANINIAHPPTISPNPSYNGVFSFSAMADETRYALTIYDLMGRVILATPYQHEADISIYPDGLYFYKVSDGVNTFTGKLLKE